MAHLPFPLTQLIAAASILALFWILRKFVVKVFTKEQRFTTLGEVLLCVLMVLIPTYLFYGYTYEQYGLGLFINVVIFGLTYDLYGHLLRKSEKVNNVGALSYVMRRIAKS